MVCPECFVVVDVPRNAREGRCRECRPARHHSGGKPARTAKRRYFTGPDASWSGNVGAEWHMRRTFLDVTE